MKAKDETKVEDLMKPRYKVVSDWPGRKDFIVGQIIVLDKEFSPQYKKYEIEDCQGVRTYINSFFEMFPLQFKKLEWYEDLNFTEWPEYIKWTSPGQEKISFFKVDNWYTNANNGQIAGVVVKEGRLFIKDCQPATETEYLNYINKKQ